MRRWLAILAVMLAGAGMSADAAVAVADGARCAEVAASDEVDPYDPESIRRHWKDGPPIVLAMGADRHDRLRALLAQGQDPNVCLLGASALVLAVGSGDLEAVRLLLDAGAGVDRPRDANGATPLLTALEMGRFDAARLLIARGADVRASSDGQVTALYALANAEPPSTVHAAQIALARDLIARGAAVDTAMGRPRVTPLMMAAIRGNADLLRLLLANGADPARQDDKGQSALAFARKKGHQEAADVLAAAGPRAAAASDIPR